jgi:hypothetical protein
VLLNTLFIVTVKVALVSLLTATYLLHRHSLGKQWQNVKVIQSAHNGRSVLIAQDPDRPVCEIIRPFMKEIELDYPNINVCIIRSILGAS